MLHSVSPGTTVWVTVAGCVSIERPRWRGGHRGDDLRGGLGKELHHGGWAGRRSGTDRIGNSVGAAELTEDQDGGDEGRHGTRAEEVGAVTGSAAAELERRDW